MKWFQLVVSLFKLAPSIIATIKGVEEVVGAGKGETKKAMVMNALNLPDTHPDLINAVSDYVDTTVKVMKTAGLLGTPAVIVPSK